MLLCTHCENEIEGVPLKSDTCDPYCEDCAHGYLCYVCNCEAGCDSDSDRDGNTYCADCASTNICHACRNGDASDDCEYDGDYYCHRCFTARFFTCDGCGATFSHDDSYSPENGYHTYCSECYHERYDHCEDCGGECELDDMQYVDGENLCSDCAGSHGCDWEPCGSDCSDEHDQVGSARCFGVEIETSRCEGYSSLEDDKAWGAKEDCSVSGKEFYSDILHGNDGLGEIMRLCDVARRQHWAVDDRCGLHVHLDMRNESNESRQAIAAAFRLTESVWHNFVDESRIRNRYCARIDWQLSVMRRICQDECFVDWVRSIHTRYTWFNVYAYLDHSTFEIRLHEGTLDSVKICNWVRALTIFADWAGKHSIDEVVEHFGGETPAVCFDRLCEIWRAAGCADLEGFYTSKVHTFTPLTEGVCVPA
jgi:hypothetical protein